MTNKIIIRQSLWVLAIFGFSFLLIFLTCPVEIFNTSFMGMLSSDSAMDIHIRDTYFILSLKSLFMVLFVAFGFMTFAIKEGFRKYARIFPNGILLMFTVLLIAIVIAHIYEAKQIQSIFNAHSDSHGSIYTFSGFMINYINMLYVVLATACLFLIFIGYIMLSLVRLKK